MEKPFIDQIIRLSSADGVTPDNFIVFLGPLNLIDFSQNDFYTCYLNRYSIIIYIHLVFIFTIYISFVKYNKYPIYNFGFQIFYTSIFLFTYAIFSLFCNKSYESLHFEIRGLTIFIVSIVCQ